MLIILFFMIYIYRKLFIKNLIVIEKELLIFNYLKKKKFYKNMLKIRENGGKNEI